MFYELLNSINNPNQNGSIDQLSEIANTVQNLTSSNGLQPSAMQSILSSLGGPLSSALTQQAPGGASAISGLIGQLAGSGSSAAALTSLIPPQVQQQVVQAISQKTGVNSSMIQSMLPALLPVALKLLNMGGSKPGQTGTNALLNSFLGGNNDLGNVMKFAGRFLTPQYHP
jgi:hypothetical protein